MKQLGFPSPSRHTAKTALAVAVLLASAGVATRPAAAQTLTVLHSFTGADGTNPEAGLIGDAEGNLYGTTVSGGAHGFGTVFKLSPTDELITLHSFGGPPTDGSSPYAGLVRDAAGNFYGTTSKGGTGACGGLQMPFGCGTVFKLDATNHETVLYNFLTGPCFLLVCSAGKNGEVPTAGLVRDTAGNLYGTTDIGGDLSCKLDPGCGVVFELFTNGEFSVLHRFDGADGTLPRGLLRDGTGNLYGATFAGGGNGKGTIFKLNTADNLTVLHNFSGPDGATPYAGLVRDAAGNLYGTTADGGAHGYGTVFKLDTADHLTVLHSFSATDGANPQGALIQDSSGNFYGTTNRGGAHGYGTVFKLDTADHLTVLHSFSATDGANPAAGLIRDTAGDLYGTTSSGGAHGHGTVFKLTP